jgi:hypothetical protein
MNRDGPDAMIATRPVSLRERKPVLELDQEAWSTELTRTPDILSLEGI